MLIGSCTRGQANFGTNIDINVITATENALRLTQEADALARRKCALIARVYGVLVDIDIKALNGATDASDDIFFDHEIDVAHLCIYGVPLFTDGMRYATLRTTCHYQYTNNLRARHTATALERASRKLALIRSRPDVADPAVAHEDLTLAGRYLFVAGFFYLRRYPSRLRNTLIGNAERYSTSRTLPTGSSELLSRPPNRTRIFTAKRCTRAC